MDPQLAAFVAVAEQRSFTRAAHVLHISQPAISQHVRHLEERLDVALFDRTNRYVRLTKAGELVYHHAKEIFRTYEQLRRLVAELATQPRGPVHVGASFTFGEYVLPRLIAAFRQRYPDVTPTVVIGNTRDIAQRVAANELDLGVIEGSSELEGLWVEPIAEDIVCLVAAPDHPLALAKSASPELLAQQTWVLREPGSGTREITERVLLQHGIRPAAIVELGSTQAVKEAVEAGLGISVLSLWAVHKELRWKTLALIPLAADPIHRNFSLVVRASAFHPKATHVLRDFLREQAVLVPS